MLLLTGAPAALAETSGDAQSLIEIVNEATAVAEQTNGAQLHMAEESGEEVEITLPSATKRSTEMYDPELGTLTISGPEGQIAEEDGATVIEGEDTVVGQKRSDNSVQYAAVLEEGDCTEQQYTLSADVDFTLEQNKSGAIEIVAEGETGPGVVYGVIDQPWALDANGVSLPTSYTIEGSWVSERKTVDRIRGCTACIESHYFVNSFYR